VRAFIQDAKFAAEAAT